MGDRELKDLQQQVRETRRVLEANNRRRALLRQGERSRGVRVVVASLGSVALWVREHPVRLAAASAVALLGIAGLADPSSVTDDELQRPPIAALPETGQGNPAVTVTLSTVGSETDWESDVEPDSNSDGESDGDPAAEPGGDPAAEPGGETAESDGGPAVDPDAPVVTPSDDQVQQGTADPASEPVASPGSDSGASGPAPAPEPEPELSDTDEPEPAAPSNPEPEDPPAQEPSDNEADEDDESGGTCLGVNALGLTVDLCLPPLLGL